MKANKNLNSNLSSPSAITYSRATNEAASASSTSSSNQGITNPVFDSSPTTQLVERRANSQRYSIPKPPPLPNLQTNRYFRSSEPTQQSQSQASQAHHISQAAAAISASSNIANNHNSVSDDSDDTHRTLVISSANFEHPHSHSHSHSQHNIVDDHSCEECVRYQAKKHHHHHHHQQPQRSSQEQHQAASRKVSKKSSKLSRTPSSVPYLKPSFGFRPHPPQWYYLLGADSNKFRKHKHTYYHKNCKQCKAIVRQSFEHYYLGQNSISTLGYPVHTTEQQPNCSTTTPSESSSTAPLSFDNSDGLITERTSSTSSPQPYNHIMSPTTTNTSPMPPFYVLPR